MYRLTRLANGLTVATAEMPHMASVCVGLWVGIGGRFEPVELNGISHFIEHMLFKGTRRRSARDLAEAVEGLGGTLDAFTAEEMTCIYARAGHQRLSELLEVLADMFLNSTFEPSEVEKERGVILEELAMYVDQPHLYVQELLNEALWPAHPLGRCITGTPRSLGNITRAQLLAWRRENYVAGTSLIAAAGAVRHAEVVRGAVRWAKRFPVGHLPSYPPPPALTAASRVRRVRRAVEQTQLEMGFHTCSRHDPRRRALRLLNALLGDNTSSRLFQSLREDHGLVYSVHSSLVFLDDTGALTIGAGLDAGNLARALRLILNEVQRLRARPPSPADLRRAREYVIGQLELSLESTENQMNWIGEHVLGFGRLVPSSEVIRGLLRVEQREVMQAAQDFLRPERVRLAVIGPLSASAPIERWLKF